LLNLKTNNTDFLSHKNNSTIHVTAAQKTLWNSVRDKASEDEVSALRQYTSAFQREITAEVATKANESDLTAHTSNSDIHVTATDKTNWNNKQSALSYYKENTASGIVPLFTLKGAVEDTNDKMINGIFDRGQGVLLNGNVYYDLPNMKTVMNGILTNNGEGVISQMVQDGNTLSGISIRKDGVDVMTDDEFTYNGYEVATVNDVDSVETDLTTHTENTTIHVTQADKDNWNAKQSNLPLTRDTTANSLKYVSSTNSAINRCMEAAGQYAMVLGAGGRSTGNISAVLLGTVNTFYLTNTDNTYTTYELLMGSSVPSYNTIDFNSLHYYWAYAHNALVGSKIFDYSTKKYIGIITATTFDATTPWKCTITLDKTNAEISFTAANNTRVIGSTTINKGSNSLLVGQYNCNLADNANVLGLCNSVTQGAKYDIILGGGNCSKGMFNAVIGTRNFVDGVLSSGLGINSVFGVFNEINTSGAQVFGYANKVNNFTGLAANQVGINCVFGSENNISTQGVFLGNYISSPAKTTRQMRYIVGAHITDVDGADSTTILGQYNDTFSSTNKFTLATGEENNTHNSVEVEYDSTNTEWTTKLNDTIKYADLTKVEGATTKVVDEVNLPTTTTVTIDGVNYAYDPTIIAKKGQIVKGSADYSGSYVALATISNGNLTLIPETLGEKLNVEYKATDNTVVVTYFTTESEIVPEYVTVKIYDTVESLSSKSDKAVTSSTSNLNIEVVSAMPQTPDANTIYIVV
jgi:hypothetical protein